VNSTTPPGVREGPVGVERGGVVVVARDHDDLGAGARQRHQRAHHQPLRGGVRGGAVVEVARHEHGVDLLLARDPHDLAEHLLLLVEPADTLERLADVPVGGVEDPHGRHRRAAHRQSRTGAPSRLVLPVTGYGPAWSITQNSLPSATARR
jgi:hypothetical protein